MHSAFNIYLWFRATAAATRRANMHQLACWQSPMGPGPLFFTVDANHCYICMEMDDAGMVVAICYVGQSYTYACHVSHIDIPALEHAIDLMAGYTPEGSCSASSPH